MATLGELLTEDELLHLEDLVSKKKITPGWVQDVFIPRLSDELRAIDMYQENWEKGLDLKDPATREALAIGESFGFKAPTREQVMAQIQRRRRKAFQLALNPSVADRAYRELQNALTGAASGETRESFAKYWEEEGPLGLLRDTGASLVRSFLDAPEAWGKTAQAGLGEKPLSRIAEMTPPLAFVGGGGGLLARALAKSGGRAAAKEMLTSAGVPATRKAIKSIPETDRGLAAQLTGAGQGRIDAARRVANIADATRYPGRIGEFADIAGAEENLLQEMLMETLGEVGAEGARFAGRRAVEQLTPHEQRKADNDTAAAERAARINRPKIDAAMDAAALELMNLTYQAISGPSKNTNIPDEVFVMGFENHIAPHIQGTIEVLESIGVENAGDALRARMLQLHQRVRSEEEAADGTDPDTADTGTPPPVETDATVPESEQGTLPESADSATETPTEETTETPPEAEVTPPPEPTPEEIEAQAQADAEALVASSNRPNRYQVENALEAADAPLDVETFIQQHADVLPQAYRENPRALDLFLGELAADDTSRVTATETDGVRQYTAEAAVDTIPEEQKGPVTTAYMTDATPYKVRPVIRPLDALVPSHDIEGNKTPNYPEELQPREGRDSLSSAAATRANAGRVISDRIIKFPIQFDTGPPLTSKQFPARTVAGTGRTNMLKYVRDKARDPAPENDVYREIWQDIQDTLRREVEALGMDTAILDNTPDPVMTYELVENVDEVAIAEDTNISSTLDTTGREQAKHDARRLFDADTLALWNTDADPDADATEALATFDAAIMTPANERFRNAVIGRIPDNLRPDFLSKDERTKKETLGKKGIERLKDALMYYIFEGSETAQRLIDEGAIEDAPKIKLMLDYILVDLAYVKARGLDISKELDAAIYRLISFSKRADAAPKAEKDEFNKTERMWKEVNSYLSQPLADGGQDSPLERQILYLLYTKRGAEKQLAGHFHEWAVQAVDFLAQQESSMFEADDPAVLSARVFDVVIKRYLEAEAFQIDKDRVNEANPWRTPSNLPPELRDIRREIDEIASSTEQTTTFNDWVKNFLEHIRSLDTQGDTDAGQETETESAVDTPSVATTTGTARTTGGGTPTGGPATTDTETSGTPESPKTVAPAQPGTAQGDEPGGTQGDADGIQTDDAGSTVEDDPGYDDAFLEQVRQIEAAKGHTQQNPIDMSFEELEIAREEARQRHVTDFDAALAAALGGEEQARRFKRMESEGASDAELIAEFGKFTPEQWAEIYGHSAADPRLDHDQFDELLRAHSDVFSVVDESGNISEPTFAFEVLSRALRETKPEEAKTALAAEGHDISLNVKHIANAIRIKEIINALRGNGYTQEQIASGVATQLSRWISDPEDIDLLLSPWFTQETQTDDTTAAPADSETPSQPTDANVEPVVDAADQPEALPEAIETDTETDAAIEAALNATFTGGAVTLDTWKNSTDADKRSSLQRAQQSLPILERAGTLTPEEADARRAAIELLQNDIRSQQAEATRDQPQQPSSGAGTPPTDTNQVVGVSRRVDTTTDTAAVVPPEIQAHLDHLGITAEEWVAAKADGTAESLLRPHIQKSDMASIDAVNDLATDIARSDAAATTAASDAASDAESDANEEAGNEDEFDDPNLLNDVKPGTLRDITDEQRSDFEAVRRKVFLAGAIRDLEAKGQDRSLVETAQLAALKATQRTDAQQEVYEDLLTQFIDSRVTRLQAKTDRSPTEERILSALVAVQAAGIPAEASDSSLYADLDTPDQEHSSPLAETRTLAGVQAPDTSDTEVDLPDDVTADTNKLSAAQLTSVKAIIAAFKRKIHIDTDTTVQGGFLLADKPGVGKTRQALAAIWHYMRQGVQKHFILAPNQQLLNNYNTDFEQMGGNAADISNYNSQNQKPTSPVATTTYSTLITKPDLTNFGSVSGNQNAIADIVEHLTGVRPTFAQTHPLAHRAARQAFARIGIHNVDGTTDAEIVDNAVTELRAQAERVNLNSPAHVDQFRQRVTPHLADILLGERQGGGTQLYIGGGSDLHSAVAQLLTFAQTHISAQPDPDFAAAADAFEGVIVLDEMHKAAGLRSQTGAMIDVLTALLPNAKFLYMSATPFKEINNFFVASRLGLWGANQAFPAFKFFSETFKRASRAAKEIIPLHLKQIGRYVSRALSAAETKYSPVELPLSDAEKAQYDAATQFVDTIRQRYEASIDEALRTAWGSTLDEQKAFHFYRAKYMRMFYNQTQKFFLAVLDAMKAQGLTAQIQEQLKNGDKIIVQLENTWDATTEKARQRGGTTPGPFDLLIDFVENENLFPVHVHVPEIRQRSDGKEYAFPVKTMTYENGKQVPVPDARLKQIQTQFLETLKTEIQRHPAIGELPFAADIIHAAAAEINMPSGEISGRETNTGKRIQMSKDFSETTNLNLIVLGPAGLTGINLPVTKSIAGEVDNLYHYLVQSSWNVNTFEQGLGRGKRANSAIDPHYIIAHQDLPGSDRVLGATLAKFAEMGALAGQADSALMQNVDKAEGEANIDDDPEAEAPIEDVFDEDTQSEKGLVFGKHGQEAIYQIWFNMWQTGDMRLADTLGLPHPVMLGDTGILDAQTVPKVSGFFQRLLHQPTDTQHDLYREFDARLKRIIELNKELGTLDTGANDLNSTDGRIQDRLTIYTDPDTGQTAEMVKLSAKRKLPRRSWDFLQKVINQEPGYTQYGGDGFAGLYMDADGHIWAMFENPFTDGSEREFLRWGPRGTPIAGIHKGENRVTETQLDEDFESVLMVGEQRQLYLNAAQELWEMHDAERDTHVDSEMFMATGMILPKWRNLSTDRYDTPVMAVIPMADGSNLHGRIIPPSILPTVLEKIGGVDPNYFDPENRAEAPALPDDPNIDIPALVKEIVGEATDTQVKARLEGIIEHIHKKLPLTLRGHLVRSAQEAALLGQLIRDPQVEHVWIVYRREGRIVKIEPMSLNRKGEADAGDFEHIKAEAGRLHADAVLRIHNHPSGIAKWSQADKDVAMDWHRSLGTLMAEDIIVDSGTFAYRTFENGKYTWHEDVALNPHAAGWNTRAATVADDAGELKPDDPLYQNPLIRGVREAAHYMWKLKRDMGVMELVFVDPATGKVTDTITDRLSTAPEDNIGQVRNLLAQRPGQHVHVMTWDASGFAEALNTANVDGVDSVWEKSQRLTGGEHVQTREDQTITRDVGGQQVEFVKVGDLSDPNAPNLLMRKPFVVAGVSHYLIRDESREDTSKRTRGDAEHIVSAKQTLDVSRLDPTALDAARQAVETAVTQAPDTTERDALEAEHDTAEAYATALQSFTFDVIGATAREALALIAANPVLQTPELKSIFESVDPDAKTYDFDANDKIWDIRHATRDRIYDLRRKIGDLKDAIHLDPAIVEQVKSLHAQLSASETYRRELQDLILQTSTVQEALDRVAATPALQTDVVQNLLSGVDPNTRLYDIEFRTKLSEERAGIYDTQNKLKDQLQQLRNQMSGWDQNIVFDMLEELQGTHRMSVSRIEQGVSKLSEDAQTEINPLLENVWGHIANEKGVFNIVLQSGKIKATHKSGDPNVNEGLLAYTSYSAYYRRSEGFHNYGFILDMEKLLEIPGVTGTVHERGTWHERMDLTTPEEIRQAMETWHDPGDQDIVIEVRIPQDIDISEYLVGLIEDQQVFVRPAYHQGDANTLREYQSSAETPYISRATRAMPTKDQLNLQGKGKSRRWMSPQSQLFSKLRLWTPQLRKNSRMIANAMRSGYGKLSELKSAWDAEQPAPGDIIEDMLDQRMHISQTWTGRARSALMPVIKKLNAQVKREGGSTAKALRGRVDHDIINFIEYNTPLPDRSKNYQSIATELKETWRKVNQSFVEAMIGLIRDLGIREDIIKTGTRGSTKWGPDPMGEFIWSWEVKDPDGAAGAYVTKETLEAIKAAKQANPEQGTLDIAEGFRTYSIAEAFAETDQLWYPHQYDRSRLRDYNRKIEALIKSLNELLVQGDQASEDAFRAAGITKVNGGYKHSRVTTIFPDIEAVVKFYTDIRDRTATLLKWMTDGTIGLYPHLERIRETHDRLYRRDTNLLMSTTALLWDRFAEIATFGQIDPYGELPPRLATLIQTVDLYNANDRETALMAVVNGLQELNRSEESLAEDERHWGMHESIPAFEGGERAALDIMQMWEDYYLTDDAGNRLPDGQSHYTNDKGERVKGRKVKTGKWKGIDINRLNLDGKTLETLQTIGFIQPDGKDGWKVYGKTDAAQQQTIARFFVELMQTKADRRKRIQGLVQSLGHWQQKDPLHEGSDELWRKANTWISIGALGWKQALQNMTEVPAIVMMTGLKSTTGLVKEMRNPEFRGAAEELAQGLKQGVEFLADDNLQEKYLQSAWSMFGWTERTSRMLGVGVGLVHARNLSRQLLASQEGSKNRARIEREMRSLRMNPVVILEMQPTEVNTIFDEAIARIKSQDIALAGVELPSKKPAKHRLTDRIGEEWVRAAMYVSDSVFKPYDARTLPAEFQKSTAFARMILKFKGWMFQQNRFMVDQYKRAAVEARRGNFRPIARVLTSTLMLTGSVGAAQAVFAMLQGRDNDDELLRAYLHTQTLGLGSVLWEMAVRSEGNPWRLEKTLEGTLVGPVWGTFADVLSPTLTGDVDRSLQEVLQRTPVAREALYIGANKWWEDAE